MESIDVLNKRLVEYFGIDTGSDQAIFRIVWANDQLEKRLMDTTDTGVHLLRPEVREVKKYSYLKDLYVLERLVIIPEINQAELPTTKLSYEPIWAYRDVHDKPLPPVWDATKLVIDVLYAALGKKSLRKYVDTEKNTTIEGKEQRITELQEELFGDESGLLGKTVPEVGEGIIVPQNYEKREE